MINPRLFLFYTEIILSISFHCIHVDELVEKNLINIKFVVAILLIYSLVMIYLLLLLPGIWTLFSLTIFWILTLIFIHYPLFDLIINDNNKFKNWLHDRKHFITFMIIFVTIDIVGTIYVVINGIFEEMNPLSKLFLDLPYGVGYCLWPIYQYGIHLILPSLISYSWIYKNNEDNKCEFFIYFEKGLWAFFMTMIFTAFVWNLHMLIN